MERQDNPQFLQKALLETRNNVFGYFEVDPALKDLPVVVGPDFNVTQTSQSLLDSYRGIGIQASLVYKGTEIINEMVTWDLEKAARQNGEEVDQDDLENFEKRKTMIFLGASSNLFTSGTREICRYLIKYRMVDIVVLPAGAVEEDFIKHFDHYKINSFEGQTPEGYEKQGNLLVPKHAQDEFKEWFKEQIGLLHDKQDILNEVIYTPSMIINHLALALNDPSTALYWAAKNSIPVYCPAFTDGFIGECMFEYNLTRPGFIIDVARDIFWLNKTPLRAKKTGAIIFGGGVIKHHIMNSNLMRNGADYLVLVNTGAEWEASDSGAKPTEALSWGKLRPDCKFVKIAGDANVVAPLLVAGSFLRQKDQCRRDIEYQEWQQKMRKARRL